MLEIEEEIDRRRINHSTEMDAETAYHQLKHLIEHKTGFEKVEETENYQDQTAELIRTKLIAEEEIDRFTDQKLHINIKISSGEARIQIQGHMVTEYPESFRYQKTVWYYAFRSLYDKFLYGNVRAGYEPLIEDEIQNLIEEIQETLED